MTRDDWETFLNAFLSNFRLTEYSTIYILYTQIVKVFRLPWELNILLSNFGLWALYSRTYWNSWLSPLAYSIPQQRYWPGTVRQRKVRFNLREDASALSLHPSCCIIYLCRVLFCDEPHCILSLDSLTDFSPWLTGCWRISAPWLAKCAHSHGWLNYICLMTGLLLFCLVIG